MMWLRFGGVLACAVVTVAGCGKKKATAEPVVEAAPPPPPPPSATPSWYDAPPSGCGVGSAILQPGMRDLARSEADNNARADLSRQLQTMVEGMVKQYASQGLADGEAFGESRAVSVSRNVTQNNLVGARTVKNASKDNEMFVLVCLDPETFGDAFDRMTEVDQKMRDALKERMEEEFQDLDAQLERIGSM